MNPMHSPDGKVAWSKKQPPPPTTNKPAMQLVSHQNWASGGSSCPSKPCILLRAPFAHVKLDSLMHRCASPLVNVKSSVLLTVAAGPCLRCACRMPEAPTTRSATKTHK